MIKVIGKTEKHKKVCERLNELYERKNHDYGDSFHLTFQEEGMAMARIRLSDKLNRIKALTKTPYDKPWILSESVVDSLLDLANYAIMTVMELEEEQHEKD